MSVTRNCSYCKAPFTQNKPNHKFCSSKCRNDAYKERKEEQDNAGRVVLRCRYCGKGRLPQMDPYDGYCCQHCMLAAERLAELGGGCTNCGAPVVGDYCRHCGEHNGRAVAF